MFQLRYLINFTWNFSETFMRYPKGFDFYLGRLCIHAAILQIEVQLIGVHFKLNKFKLTQILHINLNEWLFRYNLMNSLQQIDWKFMQKFQQKMSFLFTSYSIKNLPYNPTHFYWFFYYQTTIKLIFYDGSSQSILICLIYSVTILKLLRRKSIKFI